jgi:hypothetical protein
MEEHEDDVYVQRINDYLAETGVNSGPDSKPMAWNLESAYPNPFNPSTSIAFTVPVAADVSLTVFDILGREVTRLVNGKMQAGAHVVQWNTQNHHGGTVASGIYFYRLEAQDYEMTRKMILMK